MELVALHQLRRLAARACPGVEFIPAPLPADVVVHREYPRVELAALPREPAVERLRLELWTRAGEAPPQRLGDLGFGRAHPRFWGALPTDEDLYRARLPADEDVARSKSSSGERADLERWSALWQSAAAPRFPLAGDGRWAGDDGAAEATYLPLGMSFTADVFLGAAGVGLPAPGAKTSLRKGA